jgi:hypothetical protein
MDKQAIKNLLTRVEMDLQSIQANLSGDAENAPTSVLKNSVLISLAHLEADQRRLQEAKDLLKQD